MNQLWSRRQTFRSAAAGLGASLAGWPGLKGLTPARADEMQVGPEPVTLRPEIEPVVRWIEETPRDRVFDVAVAKLREGLSYRDLMAGLFLAGIRNIKPRPVGFKFHAVMVINSAHLLGQTAAEEDRLLPMFWALDNFKGSQEADVREGDWVLGPPQESTLPRPTQARAELIRAFDAWDSDAADAATSTLFRSAGAAETMELFWRCAVRDQRNIGHKPIFAMQCWRTLQAIGWAHAEPVLRSLSFGLLDLQGDSTPGPIGPYASNLERASQFRDDWPLGKRDVAATRELLDVLRRSGPEDSSQAVLSQINSGIAPESLWDAILLAGHEIMLRQPGIVPLHAVTAANALHFIYGAAADPLTRKLALLQAAGWIPLYRQRMGLDPKPFIDTLEPLVPAGQDPEEALADIAATLDQDRAKAAALAAGYLDRGGSSDALFALARKLIFLKGRDSHDYKFGAAAWEEFELASPPWKRTMAIAILSKVPGSGTSDSPLMQRARAAVSRSS